MVPDSTIRPLDEIAELRQAQDIIRATWGESGDSLVPVPTLVAVNHAGGIVAGAFAGDVLTGFIYSFPGVIDTELILYSQMTAVRPEYRGRGVGRQLKFYQREWALAHGFEKVLWTFDPLMAVNGRFNLRYLGAVAITYLDSFYGDDSFSVLHGGVPTDRFQASWELRSPRVADLAAGADSVPWVSDPAALPLLYRCETGDAGEPLPVQPAQVDDAGTWLLAPIPADFLGLCARDSTLARQWRLTTRTAFHAAFAAGYRVVDLLESIPREPQLPCYLLRPPDSE